MSHKLERRVFNTSVTLEQRDGKPPVIRGHAAVFNKLSENLGGFRERIKPGAFSKSLAAGADVRGLINHDTNRLLGRTKSGTLRLSEDANGLVYEIDPPDTTYAHDLMESLRRGDLDQSSFGFYVPKGGDKWFTEDGQQIREVLEAELDNGDVSPVVYPAYRETSVSLRSLWPEGMPEEVAKRAAPTIIAACKKFGIDVSEETMKPTMGESNSPEDENKELRGQVATLTANLQDRNHRLEQQGEQIARLEGEVRASIELMQRQKLVMEDATKALESAHQALAIAEGRNKELLSTVVQAGVLMKPEGDTPQLTQARASLDVAAKSLETAAHAVVVAEGAQKELVEAAARASSLLQEQKEVPEIAEARASVDAALKQVRETRDDLSRRLVLASLKS